MKFNPLWFRQKRDEFDCSLDSRENFKAHTTARSCFVSTMYSMCSRVVSDIQTRAEGGKHFNFIDLFGEKDKKIEVKVYGLGKSNEMCITYTDSFTLMISFACVFLNFTNQLYIVKLFYLP